MFSYIDVCRARYVRINFAKKTMRPIIHLTIMYDDKIYLPMIFPMSRPNLESENPSAPPAIVTPIACSSPAIIE